jgi:hypothetical protein
MRYYWYVNVSDSIDYNQSDIFHFDAMIQSKINNTGSTDISGYLLIQVLFNDSGEWVVANNTIDETVPRVIHAGTQLALDEIFNVKNMSTTDLLEQNGSGTYRVYTAFRDPEGNILVTDDETEMAAWYEFEITT